MTTAPNISMKEARSAKPGELLLGEDWVSPEVVADTALREGRGRRGLVSLNRSPLVRVCLRRTPRAAPRRMMRD